MKKKIISLIMCCALVLTLGACGKKGTLNFETTVGEMLSLPSGANTVLSCDDKNVQISNGLFIASVAGTYTVKSKTGNYTTQIIVKVKHDGKPIITVDEFTYAISGTVTLPVAECFDLYGANIDYTVTVEKDGLDVAVTDGKITADVGEYTLTYSCVDVAGNTAKKKTTLFVRDEALAKVCYMPLETEWGSKQFFRNYNLKNTYTDEIKYENEKGATRISFTDDRDPWAGFIFTKNVLTSDISSYSKMVVHIYNDSDYSLFFNPNWVSQKGYELKPKQWNTIELGIEMLKESSRNAHIKNSWDLEGANALAIIFADYNNMMPRFDVYFGNIYLV